MELVWQHVLGAPRHQACLSVLGKLQPEHGGRRSFRTVLLRPPVGEPQASKEHGAAEVSAGVRVAGDLQG